MDDTNRMDVEGDMDEAMENALYDEMITMSRRDLDPDDALILPFKNTLEAFMGLGKMMFSRNLVAMLAANVRQSGGKTKIHKSRFRDQQEFEFLGKREFEITFSWPKNILLSSLYFTPALTVVVHKDEETRSVPKRIDFSQLYQGDSREKTYYPLSVSFPETKDPITYFDIQKRKVKGTFHYRESMDLLTNPLYENLKILDRETGVWVGTMLYRIYFYENHVPSVLLVKYYETKGGQRKRTLIFEPLDMDVYRKLFG